MNREELDVVVNIVRSEPEFPGQMPFRIWLRALWSHFSKPGEEQRRCVRLAKKCIEQRLLDRFNDVK